MPPISHVCVFNFRSTPARQMPHNIKSYLFSSANCDSFLKNTKWQFCKKSQLLLRQLRYNRIVTFFRSSKNTMSIFWSSLCSHMSANISKKLSQPTGNGHAYINIKRAVVQVGLWMLFHDGRAKVGWILKTSNIFFLNSSKVFMQSYLMFFFFLIIDHNLWFLSVY